jgi:hypothetical protein
MTRTKQVLLATAAMTLALTGAVAAQDVPREDTVIFDIDRTIRDPENFNWLTDGTGIRRMHGAHQTMWEPLFILNYGTGELDPWLATGFEANEDSTVFTVTLREGVTWSDGEAFNADDVVFTTEMILGNEELNAREAATMRATGCQRREDRRPDREVHAERPEPAFHRRKLRRAHLRVGPDHARAYLVGGREPRDLHLQPAHRHRALRIHLGRVEPRDLGSSRQLVGRRDGLHGHAGARPRGVPGIGR